MVRAADHRHNGAMIETLPDLPPGVLGFRAVGTVAYADYTDVIDPAIDAVIAAGDKVNLVYVMGSEFERYSLGALWQDAALEGRPEHSWGRIALVTDHEIIGEIVHGISFLFPCELRFFPTEKLADATAWAAAAP